MTKLLIVESPAKCAKIQGFLGSDWRVQATMGHIRSLKEGLDGIGFESDWNPVYEIMSTKKVAVKALKAIAASSREVYLGSDDDREGEAIAWHTCTVLGLNVATTKRVLFHEITKEALTKAVANPVHIDINKFHAQQARCMLDMLIGFTLSPCLWKGVGYKPGLSAGRCQTPALRIIYDRDVAIEAHSTVTTWVCSALTGDLKWTSPIAHKTEEEAKAVLVTLAASPTLTIKDRKDSVSSHKAPAVFITSSLQQEASSRLGMNPKVTMRIAQTLYEKGHITYMRTDSATLSAEALVAARTIVEMEWGSSYLGSVSSGDGGGPHEGIRPTHFDVIEVEEGQSLYTLIRKRALQSVMAPQIEAVVRLEASGLFTEVRTTTFPGWKAVGLPVGEDEAEAEAEAEAIDVSALKVGSRLKWNSLNAVEARTNPKSRYTEASLIRDLEGRGIGRPSTFATLVDTVLERGYVEKITKVIASTVTVKSLEILATKSKVVTASSKKEKEKSGEKGKLRTTPLGRTVIEWLLGKFSGLIDYGFTAAMEKGLDDVAAGTRQWRSCVTDVWLTYKDRYKEVMDSGGERQSKGTLGSTEAGTYKIVVGKKGPVFVLEKDKSATFASVPANLSVQNATLADAVAAFASSSSSVIGTLDGVDVVRRDGKFGPYVTWKEKRLSCKEGESFADLETRLRTDSVDHTVGPFRIKKGPYGLYMYKTGATAKKPTFVGIPDTTAWSTLTVEGAEALYAANKKKG
jgi:DNA topoisomerase-1